MRRALLVIGALAACKAKRDREHEAIPVEPAPAPGDAGVSDAAAGWAGLAELPVIHAVREVMLPSRTDQPRFDVVGPVILGDIAIVGSSQLGFAGVDWRRGAIAWTKPAGSRLAPPVVHGEDVVLIGDCLSTPAIPDADQLLGCMRAVTALGADQAYIAIHGKAAAVEEFSHSAGEQQTWVTGDQVRWRRGDHAVTIDLMSGIATPAPIAPPFLGINYKGHHWDIEEVDGKVIAHGKDKPWQTEHAYGRMLGAVYLPRQNPMVRVASINARFGDPEVRLLDIDATGSMNGQASWSFVPGIAVLAHAISPVGDVALAVRLDKTLKHDYIAGYAANALLLWVYPLPETARVDPVGVAIGLDAERAPEAVVVFHDGDTVTILPELSSPPTAPGAVRGPSENATP